MSEEHNTTPTTTGAKPRRRGRRSGALALVLAAATALSLALVAGTAPAGAAGHRCELRGHGFATSITVGSLIHSGPTASLSLCANRGGIHRHNRTAGVNIPSVATVGAVTTRVATRHRAHKPWRVTTQTHTARVVLLGQIHARAIISRATASTRRHHKLVARTTLLGLTLAGKNLPEHPKRNERMALPGLGTLVMNAQRRVRHGRHISITVTALKLVVGSSNPLGQGAITVVIGRNTASVLLPKHHR